MSLQELSDATGIPSSTLGNYEKDENIDMSLGNLITLADFYNVSTDYLLCRTELRKHKNQSVSDLHLNDDAIQILTDKKYNPRLLSELLTHENFKKFMTDLEIYIDGFNDKGIQIANAFLDVMRCKLTELGADSTDAFASVFDNSHIEAEQYYMNILSADLKPIVSDLRNTHMKDSNTASDIDYQSMVKNIIDDFATQIPTTVNDDTESSNDAYINGLLLLFCKNLEMKVTQLSVEEKQTLKEIFSCSKPAKEHRKLRRRNPFEQVQKADNATQAQMIMYSKMFKINFSKMDPYEFKTLTDILQRYSDAFKMPKGNGRGKKK
ncbi:MAG TPA: hypothetical protein DCR91_03875 [Eubacterium sp.]|jgi:transcriptional regulator with XRE-family HTH domain|nr:hypothetical protein [Eubacterium sp.]HAZ85694.1 hypothetical protein [Eubacterium sp.]